MDRDGLADFLRRRRAALAPEDVGLPAGARRRTGGLRREEVALLAHMSTDFYTRLEQRRGARPSEQMVAAIAGALRLTRIERQHLFALAGHAAPPRARATNAPTPELQRILDLLDTPAVIVSELGVTLSQNRLAVALLGVQTNHRGLRRCVAYRWFTDPAERAIHPPDEHAMHSRNHVASLRMVHARAHDDPEVQELVDALLRESPEFAALWERHEIVSPAGTRKRFVHPVAGTITLECNVLTAENSVERLIVFAAAPGSVDAERLARLRREEHAVRVV